MALRDAALLNASRETLAQIVAEMELELIRTGLENKRLREALQKVAHHAAINPYGDQLLTRIAKTANEGLEQGRSTDRG